MKKDIWISDLTQCEPREAISRDGREGTWIAVDYEVEEGKGASWTTWGFTCTCTGGTTARRSSRRSGRSRAWRKARARRSLWASILDGCPRQYRKVAMGYYEAGADGLAFWDSQNRYSRAGEWAFVKRLGHRKALSGWEGKGDDYHRTVPLRSLDGFLMGREFTGPSDG